MTITVSCPSCETSFPVDPAKVPAEGVRAQCSVCPEIFDVDRPSESTPEAPPATISMVDTIDIVDPSESPDVDLPPLEGTFDGVDAAGTEKETSNEDLVLSGAEDFMQQYTAIDAGPGDTDESAAAVEAESPGPIRFGRRSPADKAKSLARSLVSDLIAYNPEKHKEARAGENLQEVFGEEIEKSLKEYQEQVDADVMAEGSFFNDALNSILAEGQDIFSLDN